MFVVYASGIAMFREVILKFMFYNILLIILKCGVIRGCGGLNAAPLGESDRAGLCEVIYKGFTKKHNR